MPVYLHNVNIIINKKAIDQKYSGGLTRFKQDFAFAASDAMQEDGQLMSIGQMHLDQEVVERLIIGGLAFDLSQPDQCEFVVLDRFGNATSTVDWLKHNSVFAWHIEASKSETERVYEISNLSMDALTEFIELGADPLQTIWIK